MQNKSRLNQSGGNRFLERWQYVASVWQCVALGIPKIAMGTFCPHYTQFFF